MTERFVIKATDADGAASYYIGTSPVGVRIFGPMGKLVRLYPTKGAADSDASMLNRDETPGFVHTVARIVKDKPAGSVVREGTGQAQSDKGPSHAQGAGTSHVRPASAAPQSALNRSAETGRRKPGNAQDDLREASRNRVNLPAQPAISEDWL